MSEETCDVCNREAPTSVRASAVGPMSLSYCKTCHAAGAEPYWAIVHVVASAGGVAHLADWAQPIVAASLNVAGKTMADLETDVVKELEEHK